MNKKSTQENVSTTITHVTKHKTNSLKPVGINMLIAVAVAVIINLTG